MGRPGNKATVEPRLGYITSLYVVVHNDAAVQDQDLGCLGPLIFVEEGGEGAVPCRFLP